MPLLLMLLALSRCGASAAAAAVCTTTSSSTLTVTGAPTSTKCVVVYTAAYKYIAQEDVAGAGFSLTGLSASAGNIEFYSDADCSAFISSVTCTAGTVPTTPATTSAAPTTASTSAAPTTAPSTPTTTTTVGLLSCALLTNGHVFVYNVPASAFCFKDEEAGVLYGSEFTYEGIFNAQWSDSPYVYWSSNSNCSGPFNEIVCTVASAYCALGSGNNPNLVVAADQARCVLGPTGKQTKIPAGAAKVALPKTDPCGSTYQLMADAACTTPVPNALPVTCPCQDEGQCYSLVNFNKTSGHALSLAPPSAVGADGSLAVPLSFDGVNFSTGSANMTNLLLESRGTSFSVVLVSAVGAAECGDAACHYFYWDCCSWADVTIGPLTLAYNNQYFQAYQQYYVAATVGGTTHRSFIDSSVKQNQWVDYDYANQTLSFYVSPAAVKPLEPTFTFDNVDFWSSGGAIPLSVTDGNIVVYEASVCQCPPSTPDCFAAIHLLYNGNAI